MPRKSGRSQLLSNALDSLSSLVELNVLEGDMVSFTGAFLFSFLEGEARFWITLYKLTSSRDGAHTKLGI